MHRKFILWMHAFLFSAAGATGASAQTITVVSNTSDSGAGSLRAAIAFANSNPGADTITFAIPGAGPHTITVTTALPDLTDAGTVIDGTTQPGTHCRDLWSGGGHDLRINLRGATNLNGLRLAGANQIVRGLSVSGFNNAFSLLAASNNAVLQCNYIGLLADGTSNGSPNYGVLAGGSGARIGGLASGEGNVISGNGLFGVATSSGSTDTAIRGNFIGTDPAGTAARANGGGINSISGSVTWRDVTHNLVSGNGSGGAIRLDTNDIVTPSDGQVRIQRNIIGYNRTQSAQLLNGGDAISFNTGSASSVLIGGVAASEGNAIAGTQDVFDLRAVSGITIQGNIIGPSGGRGVGIEGASAIAIGGTAADTGNRIGGNDDEAIRITNGSANVTILGNLIQPIVTAFGTRANGGHGIFLQNTTNITIGDGTAAGRNVIGGNGRRAITGTPTNTGIIINGNYIGTNATGNVAVTNGQNEVPTSRDAISFNNAGTISNVTITGNVIGGYTAALIELSSVTSDGVTIQGNSLGVGADGVSAIVSGNVEDLISLGGAASHSNILIGGSAAGQGNLIANGDRSGIRLDSTGTNIRVIGNTIRNNARHGAYVIGTTHAAIIGNRIFANGLIGIDLGNNGVTANDPSDGDSGANDLLNFPQNISVAGLSGNQLRYSFTLDAPVATNGYRIEFFRNSAVHPTGFGEGEVYLGAADITHGGGVRSFTGTLATLEPVAIGDIITATTTRRTAEGAWDITSEFSAAVTADGIAALMVEITSAVFDPPADNPFATPGADILLTTTVTNRGSSSTDPDSVFAVISISPDASFHNAVTPELGGIVGFETNAPSLTFNSANDLRFSSAPTPPQSIAQCTYSAATGYDPQVRYVCIHPKGSLPAGMPQGQMRVQIRLKVNS